MKYKKSQNAIEFMLIFFIVLVVFTIIVIVLNQRVTELNKERYYNSLVDTASILESEINIAISVEEGYSRTFRLPNKSLFQDYEITFKNGTSLNSNYSIFSFNYTDPNIHDSNYFFFSVKNISGEINIGKNNTIIKKENLICLNTCN